MKSWVDYYTEEKDKTAIKIADIPISRKDKPEAQEIQKMNKIENNKIPVEPELSIEAKIKQGLQNLKLNGRVKKGKECITVVLRNAIDVTDSIRLTAELMKINGVKQVVAKDQSETKETFEIVIQ